MSLKQNSRKWMKNDGVEAYADFKMRLERLSRKLKELEEK